MQKSSPLHNCMHKNDMRIIGTSNASQPMGHRISQIQSPEQQFTEMLCYPIKLGHSSPSSGPWNFVPHHQCLKTIVPHHQLLCCFSLKQEPQRRGSPLVTYNNSRYIQHKVTHTVTRTTVHRSIPCYIQYKVTHEMSYTVHIAFTYAPHMQFTSDAITLVHMSSSYLKENVRRSSIEGEVHSREKLHTTAWVTAHNCIPRDSYHQNCKYVSQNCKHNFRPRVNSTVTYVSSLISVHLLLISYSTLCVNKRRCLAIDAQNWFLHIDINGDWRICPSIQHALFRNIVPRFS